MVAPTPPPGYALAFSGHWLPFPVPVIHRFTRYDGGTTVPFRYLVWADETIHNIKMDCLDFCFRNNDNVRSYTGSEQRRGPGVIIFS